MKQLHWNRQIYMERALSLIGLSTGRAPPYRTLNLQILFFLFLFAPFFGTVIRLLLFCKVSLILNFELDLTRVGSKGVW